MSNHSVPSPYLPARDGRLKQRRQPCESTTQFLGDSTRTAGAWRGSPSAGER